ncbi:hypothetical protein G7K_1849-t1 [Saitoella complicata NRRL Y-17804]|uniref:Uncharacterized protein n=2 Tax=Saitoella complicata (strain BCRC 22490 / CBS 7301 / JCM 7358 / NBRC 10748 / NRRL Y-17804) TaxID=698492 RepID=A0A0E9NE12_SAICN|nr:hypothetical protein G7K_1849-t1 [Saitoella complicata NRRL Y-17804]
MYGRGNADHPDPPKRTPSILDRLGANYSFGANTKQCFALLRSSLGKTRGSSGVVRIWERTLFLYLNNPINSQSSYALTTVPGSHPPTDTQLVRARARSRPSQMRPSRTHILQLKNQRHFDLGLSVSRARGTSLCPEDRPTMMLLTTLSTILIAASTAVGITASPLEARAVTSASGSCSSGLAAIFVQSSSAVGPYCSSILSLTLTKVTTVPVTSTEITGTVVATVKVTPTSTKIVSAAAKAVTVTVRPTTVSVSSGVTTQSITKTATSTKIVTKAVVKTGTVTAFATVTATVTASRSTKAKRALTSVSVPAVAKSQNSASVKTACGCVATTPTQTVYKTKTVTGKTTSTKIVTATAKTITTTSTPTMTVTVSKGTPITSVSMMISTKTVTVLTTPTVTKTATRSTSTTITHTTTKTLTITPSSTASTLTIPSASAAAYAASCSAQYWSRFAGYIAPPTTSFTMLTNTTATDAATCCAECFLAENGCASWVFGDVGEGSTGCLMWVPTTNGVCGTGGQVEVEVVYGGVGGSDGGVGVSGVGTCGKLSS